MFKKITASLICIVLIFTGTYALAAPSGWALAEVQKAIGDGIVPVSLQDNYQSHITRLEFCKLVISFYKKLNHLPDEISPSPFSDTADTDVAAAYQLGIVMGTGEGLFSPDALVTRQEMCTMLARAVETGMPNKTIAESYACEYPDLDLIAGWAINSVGFMSVHGAIFGDENANINPLGNTTREQAILFCGRLYDVLYKESISSFAQLFLSSNGNTGANLQAGGFAIALPGKGVYYSTNDGVVLIDASGIKTALVSEKADSITADDINLYYKKSADSKVYAKNKDGIESVLIDTPVKTFVQSGSRIYYVTLEDNKLFALTEDKNIETLPYDDVDFPVITGSGIYFGADGISAVADGDIKKIYDGKATNICADNSKLYFINGDGYLSEIGINGENYKVLSNVLAKQIIPVLTCVVVLGQDGHVYRVDFSGRGTARLDNGVYEALNTYSNSIYAKTPEGNIVHFNVDATGKTNIDL